MKILVTGGTGLVGYGIRKVVEKKSEKDSVSNKGIKNEYIFLSSQDCDLTNYWETKRFFDKTRPDCVIHLASCVGGLFKNMNQKVEMFEKNILINTNVVQCSYNCGVKRMVCCLSTCIFPDKTTYPINEKMLHDGPPHFSNDAYAYSKRMLEVQCNAYNQQYGTDYICVIPTNIYGENDNYSLEDGHVIPALIHKCYLAKTSGEDFVVRGTGKSLRQFIYAEDLARLILWVLKNYNEKTPIILSVGERDEVSIETVAREIARAYDYEDRIRFDDSFSDGQYKKTVDNGKLMKYMEEDLETGVGGELMDFQFTGITEGIQRSVQWFQENYSVCRK